MRKTLLMLVALLLPGTCLAQINCAGSTKLTCLIPNNLPGFPSQDVSELILLSGIDSGAGSRLSELPLASPASGVIYTNNPKLNIEVPSNSTLGPILTQRAETIGYHKFYLAFTYQYFSFNVVDGLGLRNFPIVLLLGNGTEATEAIATNNRLDFKANQYTGYFTFGLFRHLDVSVAVPVLSISERVITSGYEYNLTAPGSPTPLPQQTNQGTATGVGDVTFAAKYWLWRPEHGGGLTIGAEVRAPTGDARNFLGSGAVGFHPYATWTYGSRFSPHLNFGYEVNGDSVLVSTSSGQAGHLPNRLLMSGGVDWGITHWMTLSVDFLGEERYDAPRIHLVNENFQPINITVPSIQGYKDTYLHGDGSGGIKILPFPHQNLILTGNVLVRLDHNGLGSAVVPLVGVSYTFK